MKRNMGDIIWGLIFTLWILMLVFNESREAFINLTSMHPYVGGFIKFAILATMGDMLGYRIVYRQWRFPKGFIFKVFIWGALGMIITLMFTVFSGGVEIAQNTGKLPFEGNTFALAFFISTIMNVTFGPMMYVFHKFADLYIDSCIEHNTLKVSIDELTSSINWNTMVRFSWLTTCLFVWIPCHTVVFLLPEEYRVLASAFLSILLGILIAFSSLKKKNS